MENKRYIVLGNNIRRLRKQYYYSQEKLAELLNISTNHLYRIENAKSCISLSLLLKIGEIFDVEINELLKEPASVKKEILEEINEICTKSNEKERAIIQQMVVNLYYILKDTGL